LSWRDRYRTASFRGVRFHVDAHEFAGGRRTVVHEFPGRDERLVQDLGRATELVSVRAYLVGNDYDLDRDALLAALAEPGPGELVHPYLGTLTVQVTSWQCSETRQEGAIGWITIGFVEASSAVDGLSEGILTSRAAAAQSAIDQADAALDVAEGAYAESVSVLGQAEQAFEGLVEVMESGAARLRSFSVGGPLEAVARWRRLATRLADSVLSVLAYPADQARLVREAVTALDAAVDSREALLRLHLSALQQRPRLRGGASAFARTRDRNTNAASALFRLLHAAEAVRAAVSIVWPSRQEAERARAAILDELDALELIAADGAHQQIAALRAALVAAVPGPDEDLPELVELEVATPVPAVVLAHRLYGDRRREGELVARNAAAIPHPGRIGTGARLEVLTA
jgi:prophage DNA circulation protein